MRGAECVVLAGDPKQLPPTVMSDVALKCLLDHTLFDRICDSGARPACARARPRPAPVSSPAEGAADRPAQRGRART